MCCRKVGALRHATDFLRRELWPLVREASRREARLRATQSISCMAHKDVRGRGLLHVGRQLNLDFAYTRIHVGVSCRLWRKPVGKNRVVWRIEAKNLCTQFPASSVVTSTLPICIQPSAYPDCSFRRVHSVRTLGLIGPTCRPCGRVAYRCSHRMPPVPACSRRRPLVCRRCAAALVSRRKKVKRMPRRTARASALFVRRSRQVRPSFWCGLPKV